MNEEIEQVTEFADVVYSYLLNNGPSVLLALIIFMMGFYLGNRIGSLIENLLVRKNIDVTLSGFAGGSVKIIIIVMMSVVALGKLGIPVTPFVAAIGALSLGAGLALQGLLSNYGAGVAIIVSRPFVVSDTVKLLGVSGIVKEVKLGYTVLTNEDGVLITIPNKHVIGEIIHNSQQDTMLELGVGIAYHCDPEQAVAVIIDALKGLDGCSAEREPQVGIDGFGDSSIDIAIRLWAKTEMLFDTKYKANSAVHKALGDNGIDIPFPQRDVHLFSSEAGQADV